MIFKSLLCFSTLQGLAETVFYDLQGLAMPCKLQCDACVPVTYKAY
jgi:hypothetical protein